MQGIASVCRFIHQSVELCCVLGCCSPSDGNPENAFVTLNPCSVSADDIIVWEHITSPLPRLSLLKTALPGVYWAVCTHVHICKRAHKLLTRLHEILMWQTEPIKAARTRQATIARNIVRKWSNSKDQHMTAALVSDSVFISNTTLFPLQKTNKTSTGPSSECISRNFFCCKHLDNFFLK